MAGRVHDDLPAVAAPSTDRSALEPPQKPEDGDERPSGWTRLLAPFESEAAAFRVLLWAAAIFLVIVAVVLLARAIG